jgi:hypothetical protein
MTITVIFGFLRSRHIFLRWIVRRIYAAAWKTPRPRMIHPRKRPNDLLANGLDTARGVLYIIVALFRQMGGFIRIPPELSMSNMDLMPGPIAAYASPGAYRK